MLYRQLSLSVNKEAQIRSARFDDDDYLVVPCVCLVGDSVVFGLNAKGPEFIPASEIAFSYPQWNGRPVLPDHPYQGTTSANIPHVLEQMRFGWTFNSEFTDNRLKMEAWLSRSRAAKIGESALNVIADLEAGRIVELSVGAFVEIEEREGVSPDGSGYSYVWHSISSDHLALGLNGGIGACSVDMGCGGLRVNEQYVLPSTSTSPVVSINDNHLPDSNSRDMTQSAESIIERETEPPTLLTGGLNVTPATTPTIAENATTAPDTVPLNEKSLLARLMSHLRPSFRSNVEDTGPSDWNIREQLANALYMLEPGFGWIEDIFQDSGTVIYSQFPFSPHEACFRRTFAIGTDNLITLGDVKEQVRKPRDKWETIGEGTEDDDSTAEIVAAGSGTPCSCNQHITNSTNGQGEITLASPELINKFASLTDAQMNRLLATLEETPAPASTPPSTETTTTSPTTSPTPVSNPNLNTATAPDQTEEHYLADAPESVRQIVAEHKAQAAHRRQLLLGALSTQSAFTLEQLQVKSNAELEQLVALANQNNGTEVQMDYSFSRATPAAMAGGYKNQAPPDPYSIKLGRNMRTGEKITATGTSN